jgi:L-rhamnonate dehydratase
MHERIHSTQMTASEHEYTRYGIRLLREYNALDIWQPDIISCGGLSVLRHIGALAAGAIVPMPVLVKFPALGPTKVLC